MPSLLKSTSLTRWLFGSVVMTIRTSSPTASSRYGGLAFLWQSDLRFALARLIPSALLSALQAEKPWVNLLHRDRCSQFVRLPE